MEKHDVLHWRWSMLLVVVPLSLLCWALVWLAVWGFSLWIFPATFIPPS